MKRAQYDAVMAKTIEIAPKLLFTSYVLLALDSGLADDGGELRKAIYKDLRDVIEEVEAVRAAALPASE